MLVCEQCGCSGELGMGWLHVVRIDDEEADSANFLVEYCPTCAVRLGYRRDAGLSKAGLRQAADGHTTD